MKFISAIGKQVFDLRRADAVRLRIGRVEPEVVGEDHAAGLPRLGFGTSQHTQHIGADIAADLGIKNGGNCRVLQDQVEGLGWIWQGLSICIGKA